MTKSRISLAAFAIAAGAIVPVAAQAQQGAIAIDRVSCLFSGDTVLLPGNLSFTLRYTNNTGHRVDVCNGFRIFSPDGAQWDSATIAESSGGTFASYFDVVFNLGVQAHLGPDTDTVSVLGVGTPTSSIRRLPNGYTGTPVTITLWNLVEQMNGKRACIDTSFFQPGGTWKWVSVEGSTEYTFKPTFTGLSGQNYVAGYGYCFLLYDLPCALVRQQAANASSAIQSGCPCGSCCEGTTGNVNGAGIVDLSDLSALVSYLTGGGYVLGCEEEANINNTGIIDLSDLSSLVSYLTGGGYVLPNCP